MLIDTYNQEGKKTGQTRLAKEIFGVKMNHDLVHQVMVSQMANQRQRIAHTKMRGEVRGGGKKPWVQKGTGRARAGSIRSPIWKGGGVTFGPRKEKKFKKRIPKKMKRKALFMVLSEKAKNNLFVLLKELEIKQGKTKEMVDILSRLSKKEERLKSVLIVLPKHDRKIILAARNIPKVETIQAKDIDVLGLLSFKYLLIPKESLKVIKETFLR